MYNPKVRWNEFSVRKLRRSSLPSPGKSEPITSPKENR